MILKIISSVVKLYSKILIIFIKNKQTIMFYVHAHQNLTNKAQFDCSFLQVRVRNELSVLIRKICRIADNNNNNHKFRFYKNDNAINEENSDLEGNLLVDYK